MRREEVIAYLDSLFPPVIAEDGDTTGLQVGALDEECRKVLVALELGLGHLGVLPTCDLVITHHPLLLRPLTTVNPKTPVGRKLSVLLAEGTACYAIHTPYDSALGGLGELLAGAIDLRGTRPLWPRGRLLKLVTFVPEHSVDAVAEALFAAGAGHIGRYSRCSFRSWGTGTFLPEEGASPYRGEVGREERAEEVRLETVVPSELCRSAEEALVQAHPYEEVAYDLYPLEVHVERHGPGRVGCLAAPVSPDELLSKMCRFLGTERPTEAYGERADPVSCVAVCGGAGWGVWRAAREAGAELLLTGEVGYHAGMEAADAGLKVVCFGHRASEFPFVDHVVGLVQEKFPQLQVVAG